MNMTNHRKKVLFLITKSNWGEKYAVHISQDLPYYFVNTWNKIVSKWTASVKTALSRPTSSSVFI